MDSCQGAHKQQIWSASLTVLLRPRTEARQWK
jgi:hypothetical protein